MVSVIVATYNQRATIARALDGVLAQAGVDFEVIIGDDCSSDGTTLICRDYARRHPGKVRLIERQQNVGVQANYYDCMRQARGEYIADCAGDDEWVDPDKLRMQAALLDANPSMTLCHTAWVCRDARTGATYPPAQPYAMGPVVEAPALLAPTLQHRRGCYVHLCSAMWRRSVIMADLDLNPHIYLNKEWGVEDLQLTALMAAKGSIGYIPATTLAYTVGHSTISSEEDRSKSYRFFDGTTRLTRCLQLHYGVAQSLMAPTYAERLSHMFTLAFGVESPDMCRHALDLAKEYGVKLTPKARLLRAITACPPLWRRAASLLRTPLRRRWQQSTHPLVRAAKFVIWTPWALIKAAPGLFLRAAWRLGLLRPHSQPLHSGEARPKPVIVSLTSYGRRASATAHLAITSMMRQTFKPDRIVLWLDSDHFSDANLPPRLRALKKHGLEVRYCADLLSYKKLIPAALAFPDSYIVTIDDDTYYKPWALEQGYAAQQAHPDAVVCGEAYTVARDAQGAILPYRQWPRRPAADPAATFPVGIGSTWWQPAKLHPHLTRSDLFMALAPRADDIWFYAMARLRGLPVYKFATRRPCIDLDILHQHYRGSSLAATNLYAGGNDAQLAAVAAFYGEEGETPI